MERRVLGRIGLEVEHSHKGPEPNHNGARRDLIPKAEAT